MTRKATSRAILAHFTTPRLSIAQRFAAGKALREQFPREAHSWLPPAAYDRDPIAVLKAQATTRLKQLVPVRHARMQEFPFAFLRGAAAIMAGDCGKSRTAQPRVASAGKVSSRMGCLGSALSNIA